MSTILSGSTNLSLFKVEGCQVPDTELLFDWLAGALSSRPFVSISDGTKEESVGWVQVDDHSATGFASPKYMWIDQYIFLRLRKDTRKVPSAVLNQEIADRSAEWLNFHPGSKRPPKVTREEIKDAAKIALLGKTLPAPKLVDAVWNIKTGILMLLSASSAELDLFCAMFSETFDGGRLVSKTPYCLAGDYYLDAAMFNTLQSRNQAISDSLLDVIESNKWIGYGFARWLLMRDSDIQTDDGFTFSVDGRISLVGNDQKAVFTGELDMSSISQSLRDGKNISEVRVVLENDQGARWSLVLDTVTFRLKSIKSPILSLADAYAETDDHLQADLLMRVWSLQTAIGCLFGGLLQAYLLQVFRGSFESEYADWLETL